MKTGEILKCTDKELLQIFPWYKKQNYKADDIRYLLSKNIKHQNGDTPLWKLSTSWSFKDTMTIFSLIPIDIRNKIILPFLKNKKLWKISFMDFQKTMTMINDFRNAICHNNTIYNFTYKNRRKNTIQSINNFYKHINLTSINKNNKLNIVAVI